jgi:hypothetical protein
MRITMMYSKSAFLTFALLCNSFVTTASAQPGGGTGPTPAPITAPDDKSVENLPATNSSNLNCWVSRSNNEAIAISVYRDSSLQLVGKLRRYSKDAEEFRAIETEIKLPDATTLPAQKVLLVKLDRVANTKHQDIFSMMFTPPSGVPIRIGYLSFIRGNKTRLSSSVVMRMDHTTVVGSVNPCDEPPIDDIGEEEEIRRGPSSSFGENAPGASLSFIVLTP